MRALVVTSRARVIRIGRPPVLPSSLPDASDEHDDRGAERRDQQHVEQCERHQVGDGREDLLDDRVDACRVPLLHQSRVDRRQGRQYGQQHHDDPKHTSHRPIIDE